MGQLIPTNGTAGIIQPERTIQGRIVGVLVDGTLSSNTIGDMVREPSSKITYNVALFSDLEQNSLENEPPARRPFIDIRIFSAAVGDPCTLVISDDLNGNAVRRLYVHESIDYYDCEMNPIIPL